MNLYTYAENNPIIYTDPTGHNTASFTWDAKDSSSSRTMGIEITPKGVRLTGSNVKASYNGGEEYEFGSDGGSVFIPNDSGSASEYSPEDRKPDTGRSSGSAYTAAQAMLEQLQREQDLHKYMGEKAAAAETQAKINVLSMMKGELSVAYIMGETGSARQIEKKIDTFVGLQKLVAEGDETAAIVLNMVAEGYQNGGNSRKDSIVMKLAYTDDFGLDGNVVSDVSNNEIIAAYDSVNMLKEYARVIQRFQKANILEKGLYGERNIEDVISKNYKNMENVFKLMLSNTAVEENESAYNMIMDSLVEGTPMSPLNVEFLEEELNENAYYKSVMTEEKKRRADEILKAGTSAAIGFSKFGFAKDIIDDLYGEDVITEQQLSTLDKVLNALGPIGEIKKLNKLTTLAVIVDLSKVTDLKTVGKLADVEDTLDFVSGTKNYTLALDSRRYLRDIEKQTGITISGEQRKLLKNTLKENEYQKLSPIDQAKHRAEYYKIRNDIITEWEANTGQKWPTYTQPVYSKDGKILRNVGDKYDLHHIIESSYGGPNTWWNAHPASYPMQHQRGIHRAGSPGEDLFD